MGRPWNISTGNLSVAFYPSVADRLRFRSRFLGAAAIGRIAHRPEKHGAGGE